MMFYYSYSIQSGPPPEVNVLTSAYFELWADLNDPIKMDLNGLWPGDAQCVLISEMSLDKGVQLDQQANAWIDAAAPGPKLDIMFRSIRMLWKSGRAFVQCPAELRVSALKAVLDYAVLSKKIDQLEQRATYLANSLIAWQYGPELMTSVGDLRAQLAESTRLSLDLVSMRPYCEVPSRTGDSNMAMRLRSEWLNQSHASEALGFIEHSLEIVGQGFENQLQRVQEMRRARFEFAIGFCILFFLIFEFLFHLYY
jgi:hypothetical protein